MKAHLLALTVALATSLAQASAPSPVDPDLSRCLSWIPAEAGLAFRTDGAVSAIAWQPAGPTTVSVSLRPILPGDAPATTWDTWDMAFQEASSTQCWFASSEGTSASLSALRDGDLQLQKATGSRDLYLYALGRPVTEVAQLIGDIPVGFHGLRLLMDGSGHWTLVSEAAAGEPAPLKTVAHGQLVPDAGSGRVALIGLDSGFRVHRGDLYFFRSDGAEGANATIFITAPRGSLARLPELFPNEGPGPIWPGLAMGSGPSLAPPRD